MNRTIEDIQKDIELLGIKGGYDIEELLTPQDCRRLSYEIERLNKALQDIKEYIETNYETHWQSDMLIEIKNKINKILKGSDKE